MSTADDGTVNRLPPQPGERIDRDRRVGFAFEGRRYQGFAGDTIASALAANDVWLLSRSFKYRRPRGVLTMAGQDANTMVQLPGEPNVLADRTPLAPDLDVRGQNYTGSLERDRGAFIERFARFLPVGFYYKAFYKPRGAWRFWEPFVRARAGLGEVDTEAPHGYFDKAYGFYDVVVIGGGPAGLAAAATAARAGAEVLLVEEQPVLGGALTYARFDAEGTAAARHLAELTADLESAGSIETMTGAVAQAWFPDHWLPIIRGDRLYKIRARQIVLASGAIEQPMVFHNNDLPGVVLASAAQRLVRWYGVRPGRRAVVATANADGYAAALDLSDAGVDVAAVLDLREDPPVSPIAEAVRARDIPIHAGTTVWEARPNGDKRHLGGVIAARITARGECREGHERIDCDLLCTATGYAPTAQLLCHAGGTLGYDAAAATFDIRSRPEGLHPAGSVNGAHALEAAIAEGLHAGWAAAWALDLGAGPEPELPDERGAAGHSHPWPIFPHPKGKEFVDFDEDLQVRDILGAIAEGYDHVELLKRFSTVGMGPSQGRHSSLTTVRLAADATGQDIAQVGTTTARPPFAAENFGVLAGRAFEPVRHTAMHHRHVEAGASMMVAGTWLRPACYGDNAARGAAIRDEALNVRRNVGLIDVSTLGGLEIRGPDAAEFMERMYTFAYRKQPVGRARYVLMCDPTGAIIDDGVASRLGDDHFYVTATTGGADGVYRQMLWYNAQWRLEVDVANVTAALCGVNIAGPRSREVLAKLVRDVDLSAEAFPYMEVRSGAVAGIRARLMRVGFVGELGYEIHAPAGQGEALWDALMEAGQDVGIRPFGVEAQRLLRLEKGHIIVGQDTDGTTFPQEAEMAWAISRKKPFFVGGRAIEIQAERPLARKLVGFTLPDHDGPLPEECHLVVRDDAIVGRVTSIARSPVLERVIGLAYVAPDQTEPGSEFTIKGARGRLIDAVVAPFPFYDPNNARQEL